MFIILRVLIAIIGQVDAYTWSCLYPHIHRAIAVRIRRWSLRSCPSSADSEAACPQVCPTLQPMTFPHNNMSSQFYLISTLFSPNWVVTISSLPLCSNILPKLCDQAGVERLPLVSKYTPWALQDTVQTAPASRPFFHRSSHRTHCWKCFIGVSIRSHREGGILVVSV